MYDDVCKECIDKSKNTLISWYMMASYVYYIEHGEPIISDGLYDNLAQLIKEYWDELEHKHKYLITVEDLDAGTLYGVTNYPQHVIGAISQLRYRDSKKRKKRKIPEKQGVENFF